jgi:hypothetical protein
MEERRWNIVVTLAFFMAIKHVIMSILALQYLVFNEQSVALIMISLLDHGKRQSEN